MRYRSVRPDDAALRARLRELAAVRRRFGYRRVWLLLRREGVLVSRTKLRRIYREERLLDHAREILVDWKDDYNTVRPHSAIGNVTPAAYAKLSDPVMQRGESLEQPWDSTPHPVASPSQQGSNGFRLYFRLDERRGSGHLR